jgi:hypothetical protein
LPTARYVYAVRGLRLEAGSAEWTPPCAVHHVSRWVRTTPAGGCTGGGGRILTGGTADVVAAALAAYDVDDSGDRASYTVGPAALNTIISAGIPFCDDWYGPLAEAEQRCNVSLTCRYLHDQNADGVHWRTCSTLRFNANGRSAVRIKPARYWGGVDGGANPTIRDVAVAEYTADNGGQCSMDVGATMGSRVDVDGACWQVGGIRLLGRTLRAALLRCNAHTCLLSRLP